MVRRPVASLLALLGVLCAAEAPTAAQHSTCGDFPLGDGASLQVIPQDGAAGVARNALVRVTYRDPAELDAIERALADGGASCPQVVCLFEDARDGGERVPVQGESVRVGPRTVVFESAGTLSSSTRHFAFVARPGFERVTRSEFAFETDDDVDREPPSLRQGELEIDVDPPPPECGAAPGSRRVKLSAGGLSDDGDGESIELLVYLSRGAGVAAPELRARRLNTGGEVPVTLILSPQEAAEPLCLALRAVDGVGRASEQESSVCFDPRDGSHFRAACATRPPGAGGDDGPAGLLIPSGLMMAWWLRRTGRGARGGES
jgi:hypothetical protein